MKNYNCKEGLHENQRACPSPLPRIIEAPIAGRQDEETRREVDEGDGEPYFQEPDLYDRLIHWKLVEKQQWGDAGKILY